MKRIVFMILGALLLACCATLSPEQKAAQEAERAKNVRTSLANQQYRIKVTSATPMRGITHQVMGHWVKINGDKFSCDLPYVGRDDFYRSKTIDDRRLDSKLTFESVMENYLLEREPLKNRSEISFRVSDGRERYDVTIVIEDNGKSEIRVSPEEREYIEYQGVVSDL